MHDDGLGFWLAKRRLKDPDRTALVFGDGREWTYRVAADRVDALAAVLWEHGIRKSDTVAYLGENSPEFLATLFACAQLGAVFVPVNTRLAVPEIEYLLRDCGARAVIFDPEFEERVRAIAGRVGIVQLIGTGEGGDAGAGLGAVLRARSAGHLATRVSLEDPAAIVYTSGTTGRPKGAVLTHGNLTWCAMNVLVDYGVTSDDVALMISPLFHVASLGMGALPVALAGGTLVLEKGFDAARALDLIERHRVTMLSGVPTTFQLLADHPNWGGTELSSLRTLTCGGSAVPTRILNAYEERGLRFSQGYGMTETSPGATALAPAMTRTKQGSVGLPHFFTEVRIAGDDGGVVPRGTIGEIEISGPNVFAGYYGDPEATAAAFTADGWFRSGDLGYLDPDGYLYVSDRLKDMIISGGENIYPAEVESLILELEGVTGAAVVGVPDEQWGEVPIAVLTVRDGTSIDTDALRGFLDGRIARYKLPKRVVVVDELPRTASGKVRKADLRALFGQL